MIKARNNWGHWLGRGAWAVSDQGLFAVSSALLNILLARWLTTSAYGAFAVAYSVSLFIGAFHTALLTEPMLVFGSGKYADRWSGYLSVMVGWHWVLTGAGSLLLLCAGATFWLIGAGLFAQAFVGLAAAAPFTFLTWLTRRAAYARLHPRLAAASSAIFLALVVAGLFSLKFFNVINLFSAMLVMGTASAVAGIWLLSRLRGDSPRGEGQPVASREALRGHWAYGRWALATSILMWVPLNFFFVVLSVRVSAEASATLRALTNLVLPLLQANAALGVLLLPSLVQRSIDRASFAKLLRSALTLFAIAASLYALAVGVSGQMIIHVVYGGKYDSSAGLLWLLLLIPLFDGACVVLAAALRSMERPDRVFWANLIAACFVLTIGVAATSALGLAGAAYGMICADILAVMVLTISVLACFQKVSVEEKRRAVGFAR
ncbi:MAG: hypothetical protein WCB68_00605 [Pyrinomonadaceae bacterium]